MSCLVLLFSFSHAVLENFQNIALLFPTRTSSQDFSETLRERFFFVLLFGKSKKVRWVEEQEPFERLSFGLSFSTLMSNELLTSVEQLFARACTASQPGAQFGQPSSLDHDRVMLLRYRSPNWRSVAAFGSAILANTERHDTYHSKLNFIIYNLIKKGQVRNK